jgi:hypothetical protein
VYNRKGFSEVWSFLIQKSGHFLFCSWPGPNFFSPLLQITEVEPELQLPIGHILATGLYKAHFTALGLF